MVRRNRTVAPLAPADVSFMRYWAIRRRMQETGPARRLRDRGLLLLLLVRLIRRRKQITRLTMRPPQGPAGQVLTSLLTRPAGPSTVARPLLSVLELPDTYDAYTRDRARAEENVGVDRARGAGLELVQFETASAALGAYAAAAGWSPRELAASDGSAHDLIAGPGSEVLAAISRPGRILALAVCIHADQDGYLARMVFRSENADAARLVHSGLVAQLIQDGVERLWTEGPLSLAPILQHYQRELGYRCASSRMIVES